MKLQCSISQRWMLTRQAFKEEVGVFWVGTYSQAAKVMRAMMQACKQPRGLTDMCADASVQDAKGNVC